MFEKIEAVFVVLVYLFLRVTKNSIFGRSLSGGREFFIRPLFITNPFPSTTSYTKGLENLRERILCVSTDLWLNGHMISKRFVCSFLWEIITFDSQCVIPSLKSSLGTTVHFQIGSSSFTLGLQEWKKKKNLGPQDSYFFLYLLLCLVR